MIGNSVLVLIGCVAGITLFLGKKIIPHVLRVLVSRMALYTSVVGVISLHIIHWKGYPLPANVTGIVFVVTITLLALEGSYLAIQLVLVDAGIRNKWFALVGGVIVDVLCLTAQGQSAYLSIAIAMTIDVLLFIWTRRVLRVINNLSNFVERRIQELEQEQRTYPDNDE